MKSFAARLSVVALAVAGFAASTVASYASAKKHDIKPTAISTVTPAPCCWPSNPGPCTKDWD